MNGSKESHFLFRVYLMGLSVIILMMFLSLIIPEDVLPKANYVGEVIVTYTKPLPKDVINLIELIRIQDEWDMIYETIVDTIKYHEGFEAHPYRCMANVLTVGHGHAIRKGESFDYPMSKETADSLLRVDLNKAVDYVQKTTELEHIQLLAISLFVYQLGSGNFSRSTLKNLIVQDKPIDNEIIKWIHIRTKNGNVIRHNALRERRQMELELYNYSST